MITRDSQLFLNISKNSINFKLDYLFTLELDLIQVYEVDLVRILEFFYYVNDCHYLWRIAKVV